MIKDYITLEWVSAARRKVVINFKNSLIMNYVLFRKKAHAKWKTMTKNKTGGVVTIITMIIIKAL